MTTDKAAATKNGFAALRSDYGVVLCDPPWRYNSRANHKTRFRGGACGHYDLMPTKDICALPVADLCAKNCALFLWATWPMIQDAFKVIDAWGFRYATAGFVWTKTVADSNEPFFGVGYYTKSNTEPCLLAVKGTMKPSRNDISQVIMSPKREHSRKPDRVRYLIERLYPDVPRLEMFARERAPGWDSFGNQADLRPQNAELYRGDFFHDRRHPVRTRSAVCG